MKRPTDSLTLDAQAMALLDGWLAGSPGEQAATLERLRGTDPALHARLLRLVAACGQPARSRELLAPLRADSPPSAEAHAHATGPRRATLPLLQPGDLVAGYRLLHELGRGGMSVVWLAERADGTLRRTVAVKLPLQGSAAAMLAERLARERDMLAPLAHPNIARLYDAGMSAGGQPFIVLEAVQGQPIDRHADALRLTLGERLQLGLQMLAAVAHAHRHMVVHRDLKPGNILVDDEGQVKLLDFGIAKLLAAPPGSAPPADLTGALGPVLTPRYAAPEQVLGGAVSAATDVYAAGVVLYELLTGMPPYAAGALDVALITHAVLHDEPPHASRAAFGPAQAHGRRCASVVALRRALRGDIDTVLAKALCKAPGERYASMEHFADDLRRLCASLPVAARRPSPAHRVRLLLRRHPRAAVAAGLGTAALVAATALAMQQHQQSQDQQVRAAAVRDFMFQMVSDAEPDETGPGTEVTGRQMVDAAVARARSELAAAPLLQGELLVELGRMYSRLGQVPQSVATLNDAQALLQPLAPPDDPALNKARAHLAGLLLDTDASEAARLAEQALAACTRRDAECAKARAYALQALTVLEGNRGRMPAALRYARAAVQETQQAFGPHDVNTAAALEALAVVARNDGRLEEAAQAIAGAVEMTRHTRMRATARAGMQRTQALLALDLGRYDEARRQLAALLDTPAAGALPQPGDPAHVAAAAVAADPGERAVQWRLLALAWYHLGRPQQAMQAAQQAMQLATQVDDRLEHVLANQIQARAEALSGQATTAADRLKQAPRELVALGFEPAAREVLRARRLAAEADLRHGRLEAALHELQAVAALHQQSPGDHGIDRAHALDLLGCGARAQGRWAQARELHAQARSLLADRLPAAHPFLLRNRLYLTLAGAEGLAAEPVDARARLRALLPADSVWHGLLPAVGGVSEPLILF